MGNADGYSDDEFVAYVGSRLPHLRRAAYLLCGDWFHGDDIVQRALTDLYVGWRKACRANNLDGYVHTILLHRYLDDRRHRWSRVRLVDTVPDNQPPHVDDITAVIDLKSALSRLPMRQRAVLVLRFLCDMSVEQTAVAMNISSGTVKSQTSDALAAMREFLSPIRSEPT